ncbi:MAG TPA: type II secretion system protein GspC [Candidatus Binataceae bacterium]|nr:type II secretion system protein GspC [Candidatus Binataceae bacterium]
MEFRLNQRHLVAINFLLVAAIAFFAAHAVNQFIAQSMATNPAPAMAAAERHDGAVHGREFYDGIVKRDVFNLVPQAVPPEPALTAIDLHLKLLGTSTAVRQGPFAIVEDQQGEQLLYHMDDDIPDAGKLVSIEKNRVIIAHGTQRVALEIPRDDMPDGVAAPARPAQLLHAMGTMRLKGPAQSSSEMPDIDVEDEGNNKYGLKRTDVRTALAHSTELATEIKASPNMDGNTQNGYSLTDIESGSLFDDLGLEDGDVLTEINGRPVNNPAVAAGMLATLQMRPSIDVTVQRDGHPVQLHYDIR